MGTWTTGHDGTPLYVERPPGAARAGMVVVQEAFGVNGHIQDVCGRFAALGYLVASPALFHRQDVQTYEYSDIGTAKEALGRLDLTKVVTDVDSAVRWIAADDEGRGKPIGVIGFCFGGRAAFLAASHLGTLGACATFYGAGIGSADAAAPITRAATIAAPVLAVYGGKDPMISGDEVDRVRTGLDEAGIPHLVRVYPEGDHGFFCDARPSYNATAAAEAWELTKGFFERTLRG